MLENISLHKPKTEPEAPKTTTPSESFDAQAELKLQYERTKQLFEDVIHDIETPANQKAQVANSLLSALKAFVDLQEQTINLKNLKAIESALIEALKTLPEETQKAFFEAYEAELARTS